MKKSLALSFLLIANILLLAHAVIPHHHHSQEVVCSLESHLGGGCEQTNADLNHNHDGKKTSGECPIDDVYSRSDGSEHTKYLCCSKSLISYDFPPYLTSEEFQVTIPGINGLSFWYKALVIPNYSDLASRSVGSRAPPVC